MALPMTAEGHDQFIAVMHPHNAFMRGLPESKYGHGTFVTECGTPSCNAGWLLRNDSADILHTNSAMLKLGIDSHVIRKMLFFMVWGHHPNRGYRDGSLATTIRLNQMVLDFFRRRRATLEIEESNDAWSMPLGAELAAAVKEKVGA